MRNSILLLGLLLTFTGSLAAQPLAPRPHPDVPAAMDVAGVHLVLSEEAQRLVQQKADGLCRHQPSFQAQVDLADAAFPIIDRVLKEEGVPLDFRYLALQESALLGNARSNHEAVGYWQLKQETATGLGLTVNDAVDERQHLTSSTRAAARYLTRSNTSLHNWMNALLSYYTGLGGVKPYTLPTDADATEMAITEATSPYVLMFLAQKVAFEPACGQSPKPKLLLQEFPAVAGQTLYAQALTLHVDSAALAKHNHWLLAAVVPADKAYTLIVPVGDVTQAAGIVANQRLQSRGQLLNAPNVAANAAEVRLNNLRALIALPGETMADLAQRGHQRLGEFLKHNELSAFDQVVTGRPYFLEKKRDEAAVEYHVLQPGERIFDVAQKYGIRQKAVYVKNRMARVEELRPGRVLWLRHTRPRETAIEYRTQPEGAALERPSVATATTAAETETDILVNQANEAVAARRTESGGDGKVKVKIKVKSDSGKTKRVTTESTDGWGEALETATATAATVPAVAAVAPAPAPVAPAPVVAVPAPVRPAPAPVRPVPPTQPSFAKRTYLPPPAAAPAPAPLTDELRQSDSTGAAPVPSRPAVAVRPAPTTPVYAPKPAPAKVAAPAPARPVAVAAAVPAAASAPPKPAAAPAAAPVPKPTAAPVRAIPVDATHRVEARETVYSVGRLYNIAPAALIAINHLTPPYSLVTGQILALKDAEQQPALAAKAAPVKASSPVPVAHAAGQVNPALLYVPKKTAPAVVATAAPAVPAAQAAAQHTVVKGETLYSIAKRYQVTTADLQAWNNKPDASVRLGEVLRVRADTK